MGPKALADTVGMSKSALTDLEVGRSLSTKHLHRIAEALGVTTSWLETGRGLKHPVSFSDPQARDVRQARVVRPDPAMLASAYQWTLIGIGLYGGPPLRIAIEPDAMVVCDVYALIAQGGGVLPGGENSSELAAVIRQRAGHQGNTEDGKGTTAPAQQPSVRTRKRQQGH